ncbi:MAG: metal ABC transporter permease [Nitrospinae bacterium]|nr:metal ABC transporter permease [Nitrospinota bacterium]
MIELLSQGFMVRALAAGLIIGSLCAILSVVVVLKKMSFMGAGISHSAFGGVALGALLGTDFMYSALGFSVFAALCIAWMSRRGGIHEDTGVGVMFAASMAFGVLCLGLAKGYNIDLFAFLFGSILAVSEADLILAMGALIITAALMMVFYKEIKVYCFDEEWAKVSGVNVERLQDMLLVMIAVAVVVSIKLLGIVLVSALLVIPGAVGYMLASTYKSQYMISLACAVISVICGLVLSYHFDIASGATIVLSATALFGLTAIVAPARG